MKKKILIASLIFIIVACIGTNIYLLSKESETEEEQKIEGMETAKNKDILKDTTVEGLDITNVTLLVTNGMTTYSAEVTNNTNKEINIDRLYVNFYQDETEHKILGLANMTLKPNAKTNIYITSETDLSEATKINYILENNNNTEE